MELSLKTTSEESWPITSDYCKKQSSEETQPLAKLPSHNRDASNHSSSTIKKTKGHSTNHRSVQKKQAQRKVAPFQCLRIKTAEHQVLKQQTDSPFPRNKYRLLWRTLTMSWHTLTMLSLSPRHATSSELLHCAIPASWTSSLCSFSYCFTLFDIMLWIDRTY